MEAVDQFLHSPRPLIRAKFNRSLTSICLPLHHWSRQALWDFQKVLPKNLKAIELLHEQRGLPSYSSAYKLALIMEIERLQDLKNAYWKT